MYRQRGALYGYRGAVCVLAYGKQGNVFPSSSCWSMELVTLWNYYLFVWEIVVGYCDLHPCSRVV